MIRFLQFILGLGLAYHYALLVAGRWQRRSAIRHQAGSPTPVKIAVAIPAHNEETTIASTIAALQRQTYPVANYAIHVVADYCQDNTASVAVAAGATVHIRQEGPRGRKGYAVDWLIRRLLADPANYDAIAIFDADSQVDPAFLAVAAASLQAGARILQGQHCIANPDDSTFTLLADADMRLNNLLRNQAKQHLGLSARLMGDAMVFRRNVLETHPWMGADSLTEDRDYGLFLVTQGIRIHYAPEARSFGQAAPRWRDATPQRLRWYGGAFALQRRYLPRMAYLGVVGCNADALDKLLELGLPPFSLLAAGSTTLWLWNRVWGAEGEDRLPCSPGALLTLLAALFPLFGLWAARAPATTYRALLIGPVYIVWRIWLSVWSRVRYRRVEWVRTARR